VSSSQTQPLIPVLATIKGSYANLIVSTFVKSGTNRIYIVRLTNPAVAPNPPVTVTKLVITNASTILFEKDLTPANSSTPSFTGAILFDDNTLLMNYFLSSTTVRSISAFNLTTRVETPLGNGRITTIPDANVNRPLLKDRTYVLVGSFGNSHGIFKLNNDLTTTLLQAIPQAFVNNFYIQSTPNYTFPFLYGYSDDGVSGMTYVAPTKSYYAVLRTSDFSIVMDGEKSRQSPNLGTELNVNFFTNAISIWKMVVTADPNNANNQIYTNSMHVYNMSGVEKINQAIDLDFVAFSTNPVVTSTQMNFNTLFFPGAITGITLGNRNSSSSFDFFIYDATLTQTRTFTVTNTERDLIRVDRLGNVYVLTTSNPSTFTVYGINGTDYPYSRDAKNVSLNFNISNFSSYFYNLPITRNPIPFLLEPLNDGSINVIHFINNQYRVLNASSFGNFSQIYSVSTKLFDDNIQYVTLSGNSDNSSPQIYRSLIINLSASTVISVSRTYATNLRSQDSSLYSNGYVVDIVVNRNYDTNVTETAGIDLINVATGVYTYIALPTPINGFNYIRDFSLNNNGSFVINLYGNVNSSVTGTTTDLTTVTVTSPSTSSQAGGSYMGRFENILNDLDFVFVDAYIPPSGSTPPSSTIDFYVGTNFDGNVSSLTKVTGPNIPTVGTNFQIITMNETGTANDRLFLYFGSTNTLVELTNPNFPVTKGYFTPTGFTLIDENFNEIDDFIASSNISFISPFGGF
jgi:hypothetical protein